MSPPSPHGASYDGEFSLPSQLNLALKGQDVAASTSAKSMSKVRLMTFGLVCLTLVASPLLRPSQAGVEDDPDQVLSAVQWRQLDDAVDRALRWLAGQQVQDGSFRGPPAGQPGITSLCVLAYLSRGHLPGQGPYGKQLDRAIEYMVSCQRSDGLFVRVQPLTDGPRHGTFSPTRDAVYNHAITAVTLSELYGMTRHDPETRLTQVIQRALKMTRQMHDVRKWTANRQGGWRYLPEPRDSDLSITSWQLMFLRSAKNAGFEVSSERIDRAMRFVLACYSNRTGTFYYQPFERYPTRAMAGAGVLALAHGGNFDDARARRAAQWLLARPYNAYRQGLDRGQFHYGVFYTVAGMYQLGGRYWQDFFPPIVRLLLRHQQADGSWLQESDEDAGTYGNVHPTALVVVALNMPNQLLPIMQR